MRGWSDVKIARATGIPRATVRDWRRAGVVAEASRATCAACGGAEHDPLALDRPAYAYLLGLYLGDGHLARGARDVYRLRIYVDARHPRLAEGVAATMRRVLPDSRASLTPHRTDHMLVASQYSKRWPCLLPQHGEGAKHLRPIVLVGWQQDIVAEHPDQLVRGLLHSDGWRGTNRVVVRGKAYDYGRYQFSNRSDDIRELFCVALDRLQIPWRRMNRWNVSVARRDAVVALDALVEPKD
ncbi:MAG: hypothetical protein JWQ18_2959 [Conexibacter sp.]|nr:hypothetical protein [Conexibacter sp.]